MGFELKIVATYLNLSNTFPKIPEQKREKKNHKKTPAWLTIPFVPPTLTCMRCTDSPIPSTPLWPDLICPLPSFQHFSDKIFIGPQPNKCKHNRPEEGGKKEIVWEKGKINKRSNKKNVKLAYLQCSITSFWLDPTLHVVCLEPNPKPNQIGRSQ